MRRKLLPSARHSWNLLPSPGSLSCPARYKAGHRPSRILFARSKVAAGSLLSANHRRDSLEQLGGLVQGCGDRWMYRCVVLTLTWSASSWIALAVAPGRERLRQVGANSRKNRTVRLQEAGRRQHYLIVMCPAVSVAVGNTVRPRVRVSPCVVAVTLKGTPVRGAVPSPMSTLLRPAKFTLPSAFLEPLLAGPSTLIFCGWPRIEVPSRTVWKSPLADRSAEVMIPFPTCRPSRRTPLSEAPLGKTPSAAATTSESLSNSEL